jgi:hypothetical protein
MDEEMTDGAWRFADVCMCVCRLKEIFTADPIRDLAGVRVGAVGAVARWNRKN